MKALMAAVQAFSQARSWDRYHDPRSVVLAICSEAGELAHIFRWRKRSSRRLSTSAQAAVSAEVADVLIFTLLLCGQLGIDPEAAVREKLRANARRYPASRS
jgi:dCTP diphosphatase